MEQVDFDEVVVIVSYGGRIDGLRLGEAIRRIIEDFPPNTAKQLSAMIERQHAPPIGPLSAIRLLYHQLPARFRAG